MADDYNALARKLGIPVNRIPDWRQMAGAPPAPAAPSYEGVKLQDFMSQPQAPIGPPPPPKSYEGATLQSMAPTSTPGISLAEPPKGAAPKRSFRMATGDNLQSAPAPVSPKMMAQINQVADNSDAAKKTLAKSLDENDRKKNLEGATFYSGPSEDGQPLSGYGGAPILVDKGGRRSASWQVHEGLDLGPDAAAANTRASERAYMANDLDYAAGKQAAEFERGYLEQHHKAAERFAVDETARAEKYAGQVDDHMAKLDDLRAQIREAKIDPFAGKDPALSNVLGTVAIALGAFASRRGENQGLDALKHSIGQNIRKQEEQLNKLERGARAEMTFLGQLKQAYGDTQTAKQAAYIAYLEKAKTELAKNLGDPSVAEPRMLAAYERLNQKLDDELVQRTAAFKGITEDRVIRHDVNAQPRYVGGAVASAEAKHDARYLSEAYEKAGIPQALANLEGIDQVIDSFGEGDIPGFGPIVGMVPDKIYGVLGSERGVAGRQAVAGVKNRIRKSIAGSSLTDGEKTELNKELEAAGDAPSLRRTVQNVRRSLHHQRQNISAGAGPGGNQLYLERGGSVKPIPLDKPTTPYIKEAK